MTDLKNDLNARAATGNLLTRRDRPTQRPGVSRCVFCDIVGGAVAAATVYEDDQTLAFLDHAPLMPGHVLVVPRQHLATLGDLSAEALPGYFAVVQKLAGAVERGMRAEGSFVAINIRISQSVPHLHTHVVPRRKGDGLFGRNFMWIRKPYPSEDALRDAQRAIVSALAG
jgi:histidine triad (HIT) family protein